MVVLGLVASRIGRSRIGRIWDWSRLGLVGSRIGRSRNGRVRNGRSRIGTSTVLSDWICPRSGIVE